MDPKFVPEDFKVIKRVGIIGTHNQQQEYLMTMIDLDVDGKKMTVEAAVKESANWDVVLGLNTEIVQDVVSQYKKSKRRGVPSSSEASQTESRESNTESSPPRERRSKLAATTKNSETQTKNDSDLGSSGLSRKLVNRRRRRTTKCPQRSATKGQWYKVPNTSSSPSPSSSDEPASTTSPPSLEDEEENEEDEEEGQEEEEDGHLQTVQVVQPEAGPETLLELHDDIFSEFSTKRDSERRPKKKHRAKHQHKWGQHVPLEGGRRQLVASQTEDATLRICMKKAREGNPQFFFQDQVLKRRWTPPRQDTEKEQVVLPQKYRETVLKTAHCTPLSGHFGKNRTCLRILSRFFWPGIRRDVANLCQECQVCQKTALCGKKRYPLVTLPILTVPFQKIAIDMVGPLPPTDDGYKYILTCCDYGTKYPEAYPLKTTTGEDVAECLMKLFAYTGIPKEILTDRGSNFCGELMMAFLTKFGICHLKTSAYHPQTDGLVERYNKTLKHGLRKQVENFGKNWDRAIPALLFAYREVPHASMGHSPFKMLYGRIQGDPWTYSRKNGLNPPKEKRAPYPS